MIPMRTVLLVDDIPEYLDTMELNLPEGCKTIRSTTKREAIEACEQEEPEMAVVDVRLNEKDVSNRDGLEFLKWLMVNHPKVTVVMISAYREFEFEAESLALGAEYFLRKPIKPIEFREVIQRCLK